MTPAASLLRTHTAPTPPTSENGFSPTISPGPSRRSATAPVEKGRAPSCSLVTRSTTRVASRSEEPPAGRDWSSDVCSSDLILADDFARPLQAQRNRASREGPRAVVFVGHAQHHARGIDAVAHQDRDRKS